VLFRSPSSTPDCSSRRTRARQLDGDSPTFAASSLFESRALCCRCERIRRSMRSRAEIAPSDRIFCGICRFLCDFLQNCTQEPHRRRAVTQSFSTRAVHAGRADFTDLGVHAPPLDLSSTYPTPDLAAAAASYDALASGEAP